MSQFLNLSSEQSRDAYKSIYKNAVQLKKDAKILVDIEKDRNEILKDSAFLKDEKLILKEDITFTTPSEVIAFVCGSTVNGWDYWILKENNKNIQTVRKKLKS